MSKKEINTLTYMLGAFVIVLIIIFSMKLISIAQAIELMITFLLVGITTLYVKRTAEIASATKEQAKASMEMAEEMREQRYTENLPLLVPDVTRMTIVNTKLEPNEADYAVLQTGVGLEVTWHNLGKGVAINTRLSFWSLPLNSNPKKAIFFPPQESQTIGIGGQKEFKPDSNWAEQSYDISEAHHTRLEAEYNDIYERKIKTVQEFRIDEQNGHKRAFLGELYFTINGRRLGEEVKEP